MSGVDPDVAEGEGSLAGSPTGRTDVAETRATGDTGTTRREGTPAVSVTAATVAGAPHRSGFVAVVGRPNVGKSTLLNAIVGEPVSTTSAKPQTTRRAIRGIVTRPDSQLVLVDTPGVHRPRTLLGERLNEVVYRTWSDVDAVAVCLPADEAVGAGDEFILQRLRDAACPLVAVVTKADAVTKQALAAKLLAVAALEESLQLGWAHIVPVSARAGTGVGTLVDLLCSMLPAGPVLYPEGEATDDDTDAAIADIVRQAALERLQDELPHSVAALVDEIVPRDESDPEGQLEVRVALYVERDSQKGIVIGRGGSMLRQIGSAARPRVARLLGRPVHLAVHVRVAKEWQRDPAQLRKLGFDSPR
ncbi:MAG: GTPase Era [Actinomycetales bacterium]|nr:GTPase Era [Actinomycetales bacterium]